jgi:uncharacterized membrane protein (DUF4010 family)
MTDVQEVAGILIASLGGAAIGLERQWSGHAAGPLARFAGIRTFTLMGSLGGISGWLWTHGYGPLGVVVLAAACAIVATAYVIASRHEVEATTEVAALVVIGAGVIAGVGAYWMASGIIAVTNLLLVEKSRLHAMASRIDDVGLRAGVRFGVMALVVLPLLPDGPFGPFGGVRPRQLWALVLFFSALSFAGYVARRVVGPAHGYVVAGLFGGLVSSTNVTLTFARASRAEPAFSRALALGAVAANAVLYPRVLLAASVLNPSLLLPLAPLLVVPCVIAIGVAAWGVRDTRADGASAAPPGQPLQLLAALQMAALFQAVLMLVNVASQAWGETGLLTSAALLGLTDVDALTMTMARGLPGEVPATTAAFAIALGIASNTALKLAVATVMGERRFRTIAGTALAAMLVSALASLWMR